MCKNKEDKKFIIVTHEWFIDSISWHVDEFKGTKKEAENKRRKIQEDKDKSWNLNHVKSYLVEIEDGERLAKEFYKSENIDKNSLTLLDIIGIITIGAYMFILFSLCA